MISSCIKNAPKSTQNATGNAANMPEIVPVDLQSFSTVSLPQDNGMPIAERVKYYNPFARVEGLINNLTIIKANGEEIDFLSHVRTIYDVADRHFILEDRHVKLLEFIENMYRMKKVKGDFCCCNCGICRNQLGYKEAPQISAFADFLDIGGPICTFGCPSCMDTNLKLFFSLSKFGILARPSNDGLFCLVDKYSRLTGVANDPFLEILFQKVLYSGLYPINNLPFDFRVSNVNRENRGGINGALNDGAEVVRQITMADIWDFDRIVWREPQMNPVYENFLGRRRQLDAPNDERELAADQDEWEQFPEWQPEENEAEQNEAEFQELNLAYDPDN